MTAIDQDFDGFDEDGGGDFADLVAAWGEIGARLRTPRESLDLEGLAARLTRVTITLRLAGWSRLVGDHGLAGRLRGTFGNVLAEAASAEALAGKPCRWAPPCAFEALFRKQGRMTPGTDFPSPWVIATDPRRGDLDVSLTLFGMAVDWLPAAAEAFAACVPRMDWAGPSDHFLGAPRLVDRRIEVMPVIEPGEAPPHMLILETLSPLVSSGAGAGRDPAALYTTLGRRLEGIARWHEANLDVDFRLLAEDLRAVDWEWTQCEDVRWWRGSRRQGGRIVPMGGVIGHLTVRAAPERLTRLLPLFRLGEAIHVGADVAFGCGRHRLLERL